MLVGDDYLEYGTEYHRRIGISTIGFLVVGLLCLTNCGLTIDGKIARSDKLLESAKERIAAEQYDEAGEFLKQAITLERKMGDTLRLINALYLAGRNAAFSSDFEQAITYGVEGANLSRLLSDHQHEYEINTLLSGAYFETDFNFSKRLAHQQRQIFLVDALDKPEYKAQVYNNFGYDATIAGSIHLDEALEYMHFANDYYSQDKGNSGRWYTLMNLTWIYRLKGDLDNSVKYGKRSVAQAEIDDDRHAIIESHTNLASTYMEMGRRDLAKPLFEQALKWSEEKEDRDKFVFDVYYSAFLAADDQREAIRLLEGAVAHFKTGEVFYEMLGRMHLAALYAKNDQSQRAKEQLDKIRNPRHHYFSFEVSALAELLAHDLSLSNELSAVIQKAEQIGCHGLLKKLMNEA